MNAHEIWDSLWRGEQVASVALGAAVVTAGWYLLHLRRVPETGRWRFMKLSLNDTEKACSSYNDMKLGVFISQHRLQQDRQKLSHLETILKLLFPETPETVRGGNAHIVNDFSCDSWSLPNTVMYVHQGLLDMTASNDEIAFLFARQLAHVQLNHLGEVLSRRWELSRLLYCLLPRCMNNQWRLAWSHDVIEKCIKELSVDLKLQTEADTLALRIMSKACFDPRGAASIIRKFTIQEMLHTVDEQLKREQDRVKHTYGHRDNGELSDARRRVTTDSFTHDNGMPSWLKKTHVPISRFSKPISPQRLEKINTQLKQMADLRTASNCFTQTDDYEPLSQAVALHLQLYDWLHKIRGLRAITQSAAHRKIHENLKKENLAIIKKEYEHIDFGKVSKEEGRKSPANDDINWEVKDEGMTSRLVRQLSWRSDVIHKKYPRMSSGTSLHESLRAKRRDTSQSQKSISPKASTRGTSPVRGEASYLGDENVVEKPQSKNLTNDKYGQNSKSKRKTDHSEVMKPKQENFTNKKLVVEVDWEKTTTSREKKNLPKVKVVTKNAGSILDNVKNQRLK